jgi:DNA-binding GntR family transcriptional regulator
VQAFTLSRSSSKPLWEQVREVIHGEIESGVYAAGDRLPTETEYAQRFSVSLNPVRAALHELVRAGIIERINGRGTFVLGQMVTSQIELLSSTSQSLRRQGLSFRTRLLELGAQDAEDASEYVRAELRVGRRGKLWRLDRLVEI